MNEPASARDERDSPGDLYRGRAQAEARPRRLQGLMLGRLVVATLLLGGTLVLNLEAGIGYASFTPTFISALIAGTYGATVVFALWYTRAGDTRRLAAAQIAWDLLLATGLVFVSGGAASVFSFLYGIAILMSAIVVGPHAANAVGVASLLLYMTVGVSMANGWLPSPPDQPSSQYLLRSADLGFALLTNVVGLVLVTVLAGYLSDRLRRAGGQLRRAEESAASLAQLNDDIVRSIPSGLITTDLEGRIRTINPAGATMFGAASSALVGRRAAELLPVSDEPDANVERGEAEARRPDGEPFPVGFTQTPLVEADGRIIGSLVTFQDLTEVQQLRLTAERAERLAALGRLATGLAHEIRNPLSSISGSVEMVREARELEAEDQRLLGIVLSEAERLEDLVTTMLQAGRPSEPQPVQADVAALVRDVVGMASRSRSLPGNARIEHGAPAEAIAHVDTDQIRQVLWNLIKNAAQATPRGGTVHVSVREDGEDVVVEVRDEGEGIEEPERDRVFDMFYSSRKHGVGIGLAVAKRVVESHGGSIGVESAPGEGATFRVTLPRSDPSA